MYEEAGRIGSLTARMRLAMLTKIPSTKAGSEPDSPENIRIFKQALETIKKDMAK
jgi:hypothetical protein